MSKPTGRHPERALSAVQVRQLKQAGRYADGNGLYLIVDPSGAKRWVLRTVVQGRRKDIGLGGLSLVSLSEAREQALQMRKVARDGGDPLDARRKSRRSVLTFAEAAELVHAEHRRSWANKKHAAQWITTLRTYVFPVFGSRPIGEIDAPDVLRALAPIWLTKSETARRVRQRIGTVLDWGKAAGHRAGDNPVLGIAKGLPRQNEKTDHHAALPYVKVPAFVARLRSSDTSPLVSLAFELLILTASRTGEIIGMRWDEVQEGESLWTVPAARMKAKRPHRVPLSPRALEIIAEMKQWSVSYDYIFPGRRVDKHISNMAFLMTLRRMGVEATAHGFRSAFRDWAAEQTDFPREVCEMALAHSVGNKVEAAYRRGDLLEKRRELMRHWADFVREGC